MRFSIADTIAARSFAYPDRIAIQTTDDCLSMTYGEVWRRIVALESVVARVRSGSHGRMVGLFLTMRATDLPTGARDRTWVEPPLIIRAADGSMHPEYAVVKLSIGFPP